MKRILILVLALCFALVPVLAEEEAETYALTEETFTLEQGPVWFFRYYDASENGIFDLHATPMWGDNWQFSEDPNADQVYHSICEWDGIHAMPGTWIGEYIDIVVVFRAPKDGSITIQPTEFVIKDDGSTYPAYLVRIDCAAGEEVKQLFPAEGEWAETPVTTEAITLDVTEGAEIRFVIRAGDDGGAAVSVQPVIVYNK